MMHANERQFAFQWDVHQWDVHRVSLRQKSEDEARTENVLNFGFLSGDCVLLFMHTMVAAKDPMH